MKFQVVFKNNEGLSRKEATTIGVEGLDLVKARWPNVPTSGVNGEVFSRHVTQETVEISEEEARSCGHFQHTSEAAVEVVGDRPFNIALYLGVREDAAKMGWMLSKDAVISAWLCDGAPLEWAFLTGSDDDDKQYLGPETMARLQAIPVEFKEEEPPSIYDLNAAAREANDAVVRWLVDNSASFHKVVTAIGLNEIDGHIADGKKINAIKALRCQFSNYLSLKVAKDAIEARIALTKASPELSWKEALMSFLERKDVDTCSTAKRAVCNVLNKIDAGGARDEVVLSQETKDLLDRYENWLQHIISTERYEELLALLPLTWRSYIRGQ